MSKIICVSLLLVVMVSIWCDSTVSSAKWSVRDVLRKCRCKGDSYTGAQSSHQELAINTPVCESDLATSFKQGGVVTDCFMAAAATLCPGYRSPGLVMLVGERRTRCSYKVQGDRIFNATRYRAPCVMTVSIRSSAGPAPGVKCHER
ncbi:hypothetical protein J4Q44_G00055970 [Coregonus suidteri]|uniref:Secreted protein n=1 Tax=Coregonus suidteri TaxID=861788 RepID=A0AAN8M980_9TELE